ncbi:MAG: O-antigen polymerase [candidate division WOR-3 bacterium]
MFRLKIDLFSPFFYPFLNFLLSYSLPLIVNVFLFKEEVYTNAIKIQNLGIISFFCGVLFYYFLKKKKRSSNEKYYTTIHLFTCKIFLLIGTVLLLIYGFSTNIIISIINGENVEDLRRKAEIGWGFIQQPSIFFINFSFAILLSYKFIKRKSILGNFLVMVLLSILIFFSTGHRTPALFLFIIYLGIYNKFWKINIFRVLIFSFLIFFSISFLVYLRQGKKDTVSFLSKVTGYNYILYNSMFYRIGYSRIIELADKEVIPLLKGKEYANNLLYIIPRFLWRNKPLGFDYYYKNVLGYSFEGGGVPAGLFGSLYANFRYLGVVIGSFMVGFLYIFFYYRYKYSNELSKIFIYFFIMFNITSISLFFSNIEIIILLYITKYENIIN